MMDQKKWFTDGNISIKNTRMNNNLIPEVFSFHLPYILKQFKIVQLTSIATRMHSKKEEASQPSKKPLTRSSDRTHLWNRPDGPAPARLTAALPFGEPTRKLLRTAAIQYVGETCSCPLICKLIKEKTPQNSNMNSQKLLSLIQLMQRLKH